MGSVGEQEVECAVLFLAGDRAGAGADRGDQKQERDHEREELAAEIAGGGGVVEGAAEGEESLQDVRVLLDEVVQALRSRCTDGKTDTIMATTPMSPTPHHTSRDEGREVLRKTLCSIAYSR